MNVSFYRNILDTTSQEVIRIEQFLKGIKQGKYKDKIDTIRLEVDEKVKISLKKLLPNITASGTFKKRTDRDIIKHSGLIQVDIDFKDNPDLIVHEAKRLLIKDLYSFSVFISPSGNGLKLLVKYNSEEHNAVYDFLEVYYKTNYNLKIDSSCRNISRPFFVSYDPDLYENFKSQIFPASQEIEKNYLPSNKKYAQGNVKSDLRILTEKILEKKIDITESYDQWLKIGFAISSELGPDGEQIFHQISQFNKFYNPENCTKQYNECCKKRKTGITIRTLFAIAKSYNVYVCDQISLEISTDEIEMDIPYPDLQNSKSFVFYTPILKINEEGDKVVKDVKINYVKFIELLYSFGYRRFDLDKNFIYIKIKDKIIKQVTALHIQDHFMNYLEELPEELTSQITKRNLKEKFYNNPKNYFCDNRLTLLKSNEPIVFNSDTKCESFIYYQNGFVRCFRGGWELKPYKTLSGYIWESQQITRKFQLLPVVGGGSVDDSVYGQFLFNICDKETVRYQSLCSLIGYLLHGYTEVKMKAIILTDSRISDEANGRTGKTLFGQTLRHIKKLTQINGKDFDPTNRYKYQEANLDTQILFLNDVRSGFKFEVLYNDITEGITVEKKNQDPFKLRTKMCITTNKTIAIEGSSSKDRCVEFEFSNYYNENYSPEDEFKQRFFSDWQQIDWQKFDNFMMYCIVAYLDSGIIEPLNTNLNARKLLDQTDKCFIEFMKERIQNGEIKNGQELNKNDLHKLFLEENTDFLEDKHKKRQETFTKWLKLFAKYASNFRYTSERKSGPNRYITFHV